MNFFRKILHNLSIILNLVFAILLLLSNISVFIDPGKAWIFPFFGLAFPYLLVINLIFVVYWAVKKKKYVFISLIIMLLGWNNVWNFMQPPINPVDIFSSKPDKQNKVIKVLTYNVRAFNRYKWNENENATEDILKLIKKEQPDIICFQEFYSNPQNGYSLMRILSRLKPTRYNCAFMSYPNQTEENMGIAVFSKFPILKKKQLKFKESFNTSMYCDVRVANDTIRIFNNHLQSFQLIKKDLDFFDTLRFNYDKEHQAALKTITSKLREAYKIRASQVNLVSESIQKSPHPVIVCGDFNDTPVSYTYRKMRNKLKDSFREKGKGIGNTYNGNIPSFRIDYIFHSQQLKTLNYKCLKLDYSDHFPVICRFEFQKKSGE